MADGAPRSNLKVPSLVDRLLSGIGKYRKNIVIIGDAIIDRWIHGHTEESQDGCQKFVEDNSVETPGGADNAEACLKHWGVNTSLFSQTLHDKSVKCRYVQDGKVIFRADHDKLSSSSSSTIYARCIALEMITCASGVLISDYDKGLLTPDLIQKISSMCLDRGIPCVSDCKREPGIYKGTILKSNSLWREKYSCMALGHTPNYIQTFGESRPIVWKDEGVQLWPKNSMVYPPVNCVNHVGAGDCFSAHLVLGLAYELTLVEAAMLAHSAGRVYVQHPHNRAPYPYEISQDLSTATAL